MSKLFRAAIRLEVEEGLQHTPIVLFYKGKRERVTETLKRWRIAQGWWKRPVAREYFQVKTESGAVYELYRDLLTGVWYLQRIYD
ncbi:MAG: hypothetical protein R6V59_06590 [Dehalococcoidia bacterium]